MSERMCACGGRALLDEETLCPACERTRHGLGARLSQAGQMVDIAALGGTAAGFIGRLTAGARVRVEAAAPVIRAGVEEAKSHGAPLVDAAVERAKVEGTRAALGAISGAERVLGRARVWLGRK